MQLQAHPISEIPLKIVTHCHPAASCYATGWSHHRTARSPVKMWKHLAYAISRWIHLSLLLSHHILQDKSTWLKRIAYQKKILLSLLSLHAFGFSISKCIGISAKGDWSAVLTVVREMTTKNKKLHGVASDLFPLKHFQIQRAWFTNPKEDFPNCQCNKNQPRIWGWRGRGRGEISNVLPISCVISNKEEEEIFFFLWNIVRFLNNISFGHTYKSLPLPSMNVWILLVQMLMENVFQSFTCGH